MADKQIQVTLSINADTSKAKKQLQSLQQQLTNLVNSTASGKELYLTKEIQEAVSSAEQLKIMLQSATNVDTGRLDLGKFSSQIKSSGRSLEQFSTNLLKLGPQGEQAFLGLAQSVASADTKIVHTSKLVNNLWKTMKTALSYRISYGAINIFTNSISKAYSYAQDLNESLNNIRIVTSKSAEEMDKFAKKANKAAKELNTTTTAYTDAALIFYQQGLDDDLVKEYTDTTIKMANVSGDSATTVSSYMTSIWNNFNKAGDESAEHFADVLTALGASTASSTSEISEGLEKFASVADTVGLSYDYATSALATVVAQTRQSADTVGTAFKTIFARLQDLELEGSVTDEDGVTTSLGSYSQALEAVGVNILDANGKMKDMDDILDDLGKKWDTLGSAQKTALAQNVAGTRQYTQLVALMDNWDSFQTNLSTAQNADGSLQEQADIYAESWEAAKNRVTASAEGIYDSLINDDFFIDTTNTLADFLGFIEKIVDSLGGMGGVVSVLGVILTKVFNAQLTETFNTGILNIKNSLGLTEAEAAATSQQMVKIYAENWANSGTEADKIKQKNFENEIKYSREISNLREKISNEEERYLEFLKEAVKYTGEEVVNTRENADKATEEVNETSTLVRGKQNGLAALGYSKEEIKNKMETAEAQAETVSNFDYNYENTKKITNSSQYFRNSNDISSFVSDKKDQELLNQFTESCEHYNEVLKRRDDISKEIQNTEQVSEDQINKLTEANEELKNAIEAVDNARMNVSEHMAADISQEQLENQIVKEMIGEKGQSATKRINDAQTQLNNAQARKDKDQKSFNNASDELNDAKKERTSAKSARTKLKNKIGDNPTAEQANELAEAEKRVAEAEKNVEEKEAALTQAQDKLKKSTDNLNKKQEKTNKVMEENAGVTEKVASTSKKYVQSVEKSNRLEQDAVDADRRHEDSLMSLDQALTQVQNSSITLGEAFSKISSGLMSIGMVISSVSGIVNILNDDTLSTWEKFEQVLMSVSMVMMALPGVISGVKAAKDLLTGSTIKATLASTMSAAADDIAEKATSRLGDAESTAAVKTSIAAAAQEIKAKGAKASLGSLIKLAAANYLNSKAEDADTIATFAATVAQEGFNAAVKSNPIGAFLTLILIVVVALASLAAALIACATQETKASKELTQLNNALEAATTAYENAKTAAEEFKDSISNYDDAVDALDDLAKGTEKYAEKLKEANNDARELIDTYDLTAKDYYMKDGLIVIKQEVLDEKQNELDKEEYLALAAKEAITVQRDNAQDKNDWFNSQYATSHEYNLWGGNENAYQKFTEEADDLSEAIDRWNTDNESNGITLSKEDLDSSLSILNTEQLEKLKSYFDSDSPYTSIVDQLVENKDNETDLFEKYMGDNDSVDETQALADAIYAANKEAMIEKYGSEEAAQTAAYDIAATTQKDISAYDLAQGYSKEQASNDLARHRIAYDTDGSIIDDNVLEKVAQKYDEAVQSGDASRISELSSELSRLQNIYNYSDATTYDATNEDIKKAIFAIDENATNITINRDTGKVTYDIKNDEGTTEPQEIFLKGSNTNSTFLAAYQDIMTERQYEQAGIEAYDTAVLDALNNLGVGDEDLNNILRDNNNIVDKNNFASIFSSNLTPEELKEIMNDKNRIKQISEQLGEVVQSEIEFSSEDIEQAYNVQAKKYYSNQVEVAGKGYTDSSSVISKLQSGDLDASNIAEDSDFSDLISQIDTLRDRSETLQSDFAILNETWLAGTKEYTEVLKEAQEELYALNIEAKEQQNDLARSDISDIIQKGVDGYDDVNDYVDALQDKLDELVKNDYTIIMDIQTNSEDVYNQIKTQLTDIESAADKIGENYIVAADDIMTLGEVFPGILEQCTYMTDGTIKLNAEVVQSAMNASEAEQAEAVDAAITQIETNNAMLETKKNGYEAMLKIANTYLSKSAVSEEDFNNYSTEIRKASEQAQVDYDTDKTNYITQNQNTEVDNTNEANAAMAQSTQNLANSMANALTQAYAQAASAREKWIKGENYDSVMSAYSDIAANFIGATATTNTAGSREVSTTTDTNSADYYKNLIKQDAVDYEAIISAIDDTINENKAELTSINALANKTANTYNDVSSGTNGSDSDSNSSDTREADKAEKYHEQERVLKSLESEYNKLGTAIDNAYGADKTALIEQQTANLEKQKAVIEEELALAQSYYNLEAGQLKSLTSQLVGMDVNYDANGNITNYTDLMTAIGAAYESGSIDEEAYEQWKDKLSDVEEDIDSIQEYSESAAEKAADIIQSKLDAIDNTLTFQIKIDENTQKFLEYLVDQLGDGIDDALDRIELLSKETSNYINELNLTKDAMSSILSSNGANQDLINRVLSGAGTAEDADWISNNITGTELSKLQEYADNLEDYAQSLDDVKDSLYELYNSWSDGNDEIDRTITKLQNLSKVGTHYKNIIDTLGADTLDPTGEALQAIADNALKLDKENYAALQSQKEYLENVKAELDMAYAAATDPEEQRALREQIEEVEDEIQSNTESLYSTYEQMAEDLVNTYTTALTQISKEFENTVAGARSSLEDLQDIYDKQTDLAGDYVEDYEKIYQLTKLNRQASEYLDDTTSLKSKQQLLAYEQEINDLLNSDQELSEYDLDYMAKKLDLINAQNALEDAQNAKSQVRMTRDAEGNYGYVYTADTEAVDEAEQNYEDKLYAMQKANAEYINELQDTIVELQNQASEEISKLNASDYATIEEYNAKVAEIQSYYLQKLDNIKQQMNNVFSNNSELYTVDWTNYSNLTGYKISADNDYIDNFNETVYSQVTGFETIDEAANAFYEAMDTAFSDASDAAEKYYEETTNYFALIDTSANELANTVIDDLNDIEDKSIELEDETEELADIYSEEFSDIVDTVEESKNTVNGYLEEISTQAWNTANYIYSIKDASDSLNSGVDLSNVISQYEAVKKAADDASSAAQELNNVTNTGTTSPASTNTTGKTYYAYWWLNGSKQYTSSTNLNTVKDVLTRIYSTGQISGGEVHIKNNNTGNEQILYSANQVKNLTDGFDTGGYTGSWGTDGKLAMLHQKELVLNQSDTSNILSAVDMIRQIVNTIDLNAASASGGLGELTAMIAGAGADTLEQNVHITAEFPNATDRNEILAAFDNIVGLAAQYANRK